MKKNKTYKLDPNSDRYRECPNCKKAFMAQHRNSIFDCPECADEFHNNKKKQEMTQQEITVNNTEITELITPAIKQVAETSLPEEMIYHNLNILDKLPIEPIKGSAFPLQYLDDLGLKFEANQGRGILYNTDPTRNCHFIQIGYYRIYRIEFDHVLIVLTNKNQTNARL